MTVEYLRLLVFDKQENGLAVVNKQLTDIVYYNSENLEAVTKRAKEYNEQDYIAIVTLG